MVNAVAQRKRRSRSLTPAVAKPRTRSVWWIDPAKCLLFLVLPIFLLSTWLGASEMHRFGSENFLRLQSVSIGVLSIFVMAAGCKLGEMGAKSPRAVAPDPVTFQRTLFWLMIVVLAAQLLYIGSALLNPQLVAMMQGERGAIYGLKDDLVKIPGVTSIVNVSPLVMAMRAYAQMDTKEQKLLPLLRDPLFMALAVSVVLRGFVAAERFAILESLIGFVIPCIAMRRRKLPLLPLLPLVAVVVIFLLFALGEYTRSWPYYMDQYDSFWQFAWVRLLAYIAVASNTGAGLIETTEPLAAPFFTMGWIFKLPIWSQSITSPMEDYFRYFGSAEFNNPGGLFAAYIDYGYAGIFYYMFMGAVIGWFYGQFRHRTILGILMYPGMYAGLVIIIQAVYWGNSRYFTLFLVSVAVVYFLNLSASRTTSKRGRGRGGPPQRSVTS